MSIKPPVTAVFVFNDILAISFIKGLKDMGVKFQMIWLLFVLIIYHIVAIRTPL
jgi:hypothetical protein